MLEKIKKIRVTTGAGMVEIKKALEESAGDESGAIEILRKKGQEKAMKKTERSTQEGIVASYIHSNGKVGSIVKLLCETDFVARNDEFKALASDIAMHITAMNSTEETLLDQPFVKNPDITISELVAQHIGKIGENIKIGEFKRIEL